MSGQRVLGVLVIGGAGYIGSHVTKVLLTKGYHPVILDDLSTGHRSVMKHLSGVPFYEGNAGDAALLTQIFEKHSVSAVMHFGAKALVAESLVDPLAYYRANVAETLSLLEVMVGCGVRTIVFSSTCATYGEPQGTLIEESPQLPINPYGRSKLMIEQVLRDCAIAYGLRCAVLRYFNAAGADPEALLGEDHRPETHLIPLVIRAALKGAGNPEGKLTIYGSDYATPDGSCIRDYIHVNDLAAGHILALEYLQENGGFFDFNLGGGKGYSNFEVVAAVEKVLGKKIIFEMGQRRPGDPPVLVADTTKARKILNWRPEYSLNQIIETAHAWLVAHPQGYETYEGHEE